MLLCLNGLAMVQGPGNYDPKESDVFVVTPGRSGTMFMLNLLHQLRTSGDEMFEHVERLGHHYVPITGGAFDYLNEKQFGGPPQLFYTHGLPSQVPEARRYVYIQRDPVSITTSWFSMVTQFYALRNPLSLEDFYYNCLRQHCFFPKRFIFHHVSEWWKQKQAFNESVLWVNFEQLIGNLNQTLAYAKTVADFTNIDFSLLGAQGAAKSKIESLISAKFANTNSNRFNLFDMQVSVAIISDTCMNNENYFFLSEAAGVKSIRDLGGKKPAVSHGVKRDIQRHWNNIVTPTTGFETYDHMRTKTCI